MRFKSQTPSYGTGFNTVFRPETLSHVKTFWDNGKFDRATNKQK